MKRRCPLVRCTAAVLLAVVPAGCYTYERALQPPAPGSDVRVRLTAPGALRMSELTDETTRTYEGELVQAGDDTVKISILRSRAQSDYQSRRTLHNTLIFPRSDVAAVETRTLSPWKTTAAVVGAAGIAGALLANVATGGGGGGGPPPDPPPTGARIPLLILPIP